MIDAIAGQQADAKRSWRATIFDNPKLELWIIWWCMPIFYNVYTGAYFVLSKTQPPPSPAFDARHIEAFMQSVHQPLQLAYTLIYLLLGIPGWHVAMIFVLMTRMSVHNVWAYSYLLVMTAATLPGALMNAFAYSILAMRGHGDPKVVEMLYDFANLTFVGSMGVFFVGSVVLTIAILLDKNSVLPKWFGYACIWNLTTEFTVAPVWIFHDGSMAWNGSVTYIWNMVIYGVWQVMYIVVFYQAIRKLPFVRPPAIPGGRALVSGARL